MTARALTALAAAALLATTTAPTITTPDTNDDVLYRISDEDYYRMPELFQLDEYPGCLATGGVYCMGSFELSAPPDNQLFQIMKRWSANWVNNFNHTRLHRGLCLTRSCRQHHDHHSEAWFTSCVNASMSEYGLTARLYQLDYCAHSPPEQPPLTSNERAFAAMLATLLALTALSTALDLTLSDHAKKGAGWSLSWSLRQSWRTLTAPAPSSADTDLSSLDGLRVFAMMCVIVEHVCWLTTHAYVADTKTFEQIRRAPEVMLMTNSTLVVQIFFIMSTFLLAHKLLLDTRPTEHPIRTFFNTILNRIIRISPSHLMVVWFAGTWWERLNSGPQWAPLISSEAAVCRTKWWTHLLFLNNIIYKDDKCLIQTWYLAVDMQLYICALALTLALRGRRCALPVLGSLFLLATFGLMAYAYAWSLVPTYVLHNPESVRVSYSGDASFNALYQSAGGNAAGALAGLLLAHAHHALRRAGLRPARWTWFRWASVLGAPLAAWWAAASPFALGEGVPGRAPAAALAALERPVFATAVCVALLGAMNGVTSPWRTWFSSGGTVLARLSFGALLLHLPLNMALIASRHAPTQINHSIAIFEWFGVAAISYAAAVPLALLVELPAQRLLRHLRAACAPSRAHTRGPREHKTDM